MATMGDNIVQPEPGPPGTAKLYVFHETLKFGELCFKVWYKESSKQSLGCFFVSTNCGRKRYGYRHGYFPCDVEIPNL